MEEQIPGVVYLELPSSSAFGSQTEAALERIGAGVGEGLSLDEVMDAVWRETGGLLPRDRVGLSFIEDDGARVVCRWARADYPGILLGLDYGAGLAGSSLQGILDTGRARVISNLESYLSRRPESASTATLVQEGVRSSLTLPLKVGERSVGFLFFSSRKADAFGEAHVRVLRGVRDRIAQAVEKAWLIKRLQDAKEAYFSTLGFIAHELKSPLAGIVARAETYAGGYLGDVDPKAAEVLRNIVTTSGYMTNMVRDYLDLSRLETGDLRFEPKDGVRLRKDVLDFAAESAHLWAEQRGSRIVLDVPEREVLVRGDVDLLRILLSNLVDNAVKYGFDKAEVRVRARVEEDGRLVVAVRNPGVGFTEEQAGKLFKRFSRLRQKGVEDRKGSGLGLYLCWFIAQKHGGSLSAASQPGEWAEFTLKLPGARLE